MTDLIITGETVQFNLDVVKRGGFIRAKYHTWADFRNGLVTLVKPARLTCIFLVGANAIVRYFDVKASEVADAYWQISYSNDLEELNYETR